MNNIIICEDDGNQRKQLESVLATELKKYNCKIALSTNNPHEVVRHIDNRTSSFVYFLDVDLNSDLNGFELAKLIRTYDPNGYIIFLTGHAELTLLTFQYKVQALDYIIKGDVNILKTKVSDCLNAVHTTLSAAKAKVDTKISIEVGNNVVLLDFDDILFFETSDKEHKISVHTFTGQTEFYGTLKNIEKIVSSDFYKTHRSYLVNTKKIKSIDKSSMVIEMINDEVCYVSLRYLKGLLKKCLQ